MAKFILNGGWKIPYYEFMWMLIGGTLVAGGGAVIDRYRQSGTPLLPEVQIVVEQDPPVAAQEISNEELAAKVDQIIQPEAKVEVTPSSTATKTQVTEQVQTTQAPSLALPYYSLQVGVFLNKDGALAQVKSLEKDGLAAFTVLRQINGRGLNYVYVGRFPVKQAALEYRAQLQSQASLKSVLFQFTK